jgi:hypothetical protein
MPGRPSPVRGSCSRRAGRDGDGGEIVERGARVAGEPIDRPYGIREFPARNVNGVDIVFGQDAQVGAGKFSTAQLAGAPDTRPVRWLGLKPLGPRDALRPAAGS